MYNYWKGVRGWWAWISGIVGLMVVLEEGVTVAGRCCWEWCAVCLPVTGTDLCHWCGGHAGDHVGPWRADRLTGASTMHSTVTTFLWHHKHCTLSVGILFLHYTRCSFKHQVFGMRNELETVGREGKGRINKLPRGCYRTPVLISWPYEVETGNVFFCCACVCLLVVVYRMWVMIVLSCHHIQIYHIYLQGWKYSTRKPLLELDHSICVYPWLFSYIPRPCLMHVTVGRFFLSYILLTPMLTLLLDTSHQCIYYLSALQFSLCYFFPLANVLT